MSYQKNVYLNIRNIPLPLSALETNDKAATKEVRFTWRIAVKNIYSRIYKEFSFSSNLTKNANINMVRVIVYQQQ